MKNLYSFLLIFFSFFATDLSAQLTPAEAVAEMGRGINLGNTLEPPTEGAWNNGPAQEAFFDAYLEAGFSNIRIPVRWDEHTMDNAPFSIEETWMDRVEQVVDWGLSRGFFITLNGHHEDWLKNDYGNPVLRARYDSIWVQVAERFQNKSDKLLFEIINEPKGMAVAEVDELNQRILGIIRATNPTRIVIYGGNEWANAEQLLNAAIPEDDYVIGYYHAYDPWSFSGQGQGTWGTANDYQQLNNKYQSVKNWSDANNIPVHHSEFGAIHICDFNSRMRIYAHNVEQCIVNGFAFSVWDDGGDFGILNRSNNSWPELKDVLLHYHEDSPNQIFSNFVPNPMTNAPTVVVTWNNRVTGNANIILERLVGASGGFVQIADLPAGTNTFTDEDVEAGKTYTYRMYTTRADGTLLHGYPTRVKIVATEQSSFNGTPIAIPGELEMEEYDLGGEGLAYHDNEPANIPGGFRVDEGVDIGAQGDAYILEYVAEGEWIEYTVDVAQAGVYKVDAITASQVANGSFSISFDKNNASTNFTVPSTGDWYTFQEITANSTIALEAGEQQMRLTINNNNPFNVDKLSFTLDPSTNTQEIEKAEEALVLNPNPTNGFVKLELSSALEQNHSLELLDLTGRKLASYEVTGRFISLDLTNFESGLYLVRLVRDDITLIRRVIKY